LQGRKRVGRGEGDAGDRANEDPGTPCAERGTE
jgi:hypothetical protein